jgi:hypothetical protein
MKHTPAETGVISSKSQVHPISFCLQNVLLLFHWVLHLYCTVIVFCRETKNPPISVLTLFKWLNLMRNAFLWNLINYSYKLLQYKNIYILSIVKKKITILKNLSVNLRVCELG